MTCRRVSFYAVLILALLALSPAQGNHTAAATSYVSFERVSTTGGGDYAALSGDGQVVVFSSHADDLVPGQVEDSWDVYLYDRQRGGYERISVHSDGSPAYNSGAYDSPPDISGDGQVVVFLSDADLSGSDDNGMTDIYARVRSAGTTELVSVGMNGQPANGPSFIPAVSPDGRYVVFQSQASNLVSDDTNDGLDVFLRDRVTGETTRLSLGENGGQGADPHDYGYSSTSVSTGGQRAVFSYQGLPGSGPLETVYLYDRQAGSTQSIAPGTLPAISADGQVVVFLSSEALVSGDTDGAADWYAWEESAGFTRIAPGGDGVTCPPALSTGGEVIAIQSTAALAAEDTNGRADIYLHERSSGTNLLVSIPASGEPADGDSGFPAISADGQVVAFSSLAGNLTADDLNGRYDVFTSDNPGEGIIPISGAVLDNLIFLPVVAK